VLLIQPHHEAERSIGGGEIEYWGTTLLTLLSTLSFCRNPIPFEVYLSTKGFKFNLFLDYSPYHLIGEIYDEIQYSGEAIGSSDCHYS
jgi:hypothetical protein